MHDPQQQREQWYRTFPGMGLTKIERSHLTRLLKKSKGQVLIQVGGPADLSLIEKSPIKHRIHLDTAVHQHASLPCAQTHLDEIPIAPDSVDAIVLVHSLSFVDDPQAVLHEMYRTLKGEGDLFILGFNPWSLWGLAHKNGNRHGYPWNGRFWSRSKIMRWLNVLDYCVVSTRTLCFRPPVQSKKWWRALLPMEYMGYVLMPWMGSVYLIHAKRRVKNGTPILDPAWWVEKVSSAQRLTEPTTRLTR